MQVCTVVYVSFTIFRPVLDSLPPKQPKVGFGTFKNVCHMTTLTVRLWQNWIGARSGNHDEGGQVATRQAGASLFIAIHQLFNEALLGTDGDTKKDDFLEKFQTAFDPPPPLIFGKSCYGFRDKSAYVHYGGTVMYYMILFPMIYM